MPKLMLFVRSKPGTTHEAFREHYETVHTPLALTNMTGLDRYVRNYTVPFPGQPEPAYDCVSEMWFADQAPCRRRWDGSAATRARPSAPTKSCSRTARA